MKRKLTIFFSLALIALAGTLFMSMDKPENIPQNAVAQLYPNGGIQVYTNRLVPTLISGDAVLEFEVIQIAGNYELLRRGISNGFRVTERLKLNISNGFLVYTPGTQRKCFGMCIGYCHPVGAIDCECNGDCYSDPLRLIELPEVIRPEFLGPTP